MNNPLFFRTDRRPEPVLAFPQPIRIAVAIVVVEVPQHEVHEQVGRQRSGDGNPATSILPQRHVALRVREGKLSPVGIVINPQR